MKFSKSRPVFHFRNREAQIGLLDSVFIRNEGYEPGFNRTMFDEDFSFIFHYPHRQSSTLFDVTTSNQDLTEQLLESVDTRYSPYGVQEAVREWAEEIANTLIWSDEAYYHVGDGPNTDSMRIVSFGPSGVSTWLGVTFQWVPRHVVRHWDREDEEKPREVRILNRHKVLRFKMPKNLRRILRAQNRILATIDRHKFGAANFYTQATHEVPSPMNHFDFSVWRENQEQALYRSTRQTGWHGRKYGESKRSDFFDCHRKIRFRRNQLLLRDDILRQIGSELTRVGRKYDAEYAVSIAPTGALPQVYQLDDLESRLKREEASFKEVIDFA